MHTSTVYLMFFYMFSESCRDVHVEFEDALMTGTLVSTRCVCMNVGIPCIDPSLFNTIYFAITDRS
jgi:hypothetical protein